MKYETPTFEIAIFETENILSASKDNFEVEETNGIGSFIFDALDVFR